MDVKEVEDNVLDWIAELDFKILKVTKTETTNFIFVIKSKENSILNFPIVVTSSKKPEALMLSLIGVIKGEDNKSFRGTDKTYREKMLEELENRASISNLGLGYSSNKEETRIRGIRTIRPDDINKESFFMAISDLHVYRDYLHYLLKKYKLVKPKGIDYGV